MITTERIAYRPAEALEKLPIGRTVFYELLRSGEIASFRVAARASSPMKP